MLDLAAQVEALKASNDQFRDLLAMKTVKNDPYQVWDCLRIMADATEHLLKDHDCDTHGHEVMKAAMDAARKHLTAMEVAKTLCESEDGK